MRLSSTFVAPLAVGIPVNCIAGWPKRHGSVANRNRLRHHASQHLHRRAEASGEATSAGAGGNQSFISPDRAGR